MNNLELLSFIEKTNNYLSADNSFTYEISFLKIYVKFEKFCGDVFEGYCLGETSSKNYVPKRRLTFDDIKQLRKIINGGDNKKYVDYFKKIETLSKEIFVDDPFSLVFETAKYTTAINKMTCIRNYIAHESDSSRKKYIESCLSNKKFIEPGNYLMSNNKKKSVSEYSLYIETIKEISELLLNPIF